MRFWDFEVKEDTERCAATVAEELGDSAKSCMPVRPARRCRPQSFRSMSLEPPTCASMPSTKEARRERRPTSASPPPARAATRAASATRSIPPEGATLLILYTDLADPDWPDYLDVDLGHFTYYGDNKRPGHALHETPRGGNRALRDLFDAVHANPPQRETLPPIFVFSKTRPGRRVVFRGLAVPGAREVSAARRSRRDLADSRRTALPELPRDLHHSRCRSGHPFLAKRDSGWDPRDRCPRSVAEMAQDGPIHAAHRQAAKDPLPRRAAASRARRPGDGASNLRVLRRSARVRKVRCCALGTGSRCCRLRSD